MNPRFRTASLSAAAVALAGALVVALAGCGGGSGAAPGAAASATPSAAPSSAAAPGASGAAASTAGPGGSSGSGGGSGSSGSSGSSGGASPVVDNACTVFTLDDLRVPLGITDLGAGDSTGFKVVYNSDKLPVVQCDWEQGSGAPEDFTIHLDVYNFATVEKATRDLDDSKVNAGSLTSEVVTGVADQALFARAGTKPVQAALFWRKGSVVYHLSAVRLAGVDRPAMEAKLKQAVVRKFS